MRPDSSGLRAIDPQRYDGVIFDMDGVVTRTADVHADAWRRVFDEFLEREAAERGTEFTPFDVDEDYRRYVDGKPRYDGVSSFLESRGIELPFGEPSDPPDRRTVCGLGNRKNEAFLVSLQENGVKAFSSTLRFIEALKRSGVRVAIISASRNAEAVLSAAGCLEIFEARVDGLVADRENLAGKPAPDVFLEAARRIAVEPARAVVVEDAIAGVQAGKAGGFGLVVGVDRTGHAEDLKRNGADIVVDDLSKLSVGGEPLPNAIERIPEIVGSARDRRLAVFLDYDGTLTPIVDRPQDAVLSRSMRDAVARLAQVCIVGIISGRDLDDVRERVGLPDLYYAGSHGFDIRGPGVERQLGSEAKPALDRAAAALRERLKDVDGAIIETKRFSLAVHYRLVAAEQVQLVSDAADAALEPELKRFDGKKVIEIQPKMDWHKGKALMTLLETLKLDETSAMPLYIGDDTTDENAFRAIRDFGVGIVVRDELYETAASYALPDTQQVEQFLADLADAAEGGER